MANEIWHSYEEGKTLYALIWLQTADTIFDQSDGGDTWETYVEANIDNYDVAMTNQGDGVGGYSDYYSVDFPAVIITSGVYRVQIFVQAGGSISADDDIAVAQGELYWDGAAEETIHTIVITNTTVTNVYDESTPPPITVIDETLRI